MGNRWDDFDPTITPHPFLDDVYCVPLGNGGHALVEGEDVCRVDEYRWHKVKQACDPRTWYARTTITTPSGKRVTLIMSRLLYGLTREDRVEVDHENHDGLDNRRKANLRLSSARQNSINRRKFRYCSSPYKGVSWHAVSGKWAAQIGVSVGNRKSMLTLGFYEIEEEAAFAFQIAAPLLQDPGFLCLMPVPLDKMPDTDRQHEIRAVVLSKIKAKLAGNKCNLRATSSYAGVHLVGGTHCWRATVKADRSHYFLGSYKTEPEAAFAYNYGIQILKLTGRSLNEFEAQDVLSTERAEEIRCDVGKRIASRGDKLKRGCTSRYINVRWDKTNKKWIAGINYEKKTIHIGRFPKEAEAAFACNMAALALGTKTKVNQIPAADMPPPERLEEIRLQIKSRLALRVG